MTKAECLAYAERARQAANEANKRVALLSVTLGGDDEITQSTMREADAANSAALEWEKVATWHPQTRAKALRNRALPTSMFGY